MEPWTEYKLNQKMLKQRKFRFPVFGCSAEAQKPALVPENRSVKMAKEPAALGGISDFSAKGDTSFEK